MPDGQTVPAHDASMDALADQIEAALVNSGHDIAGFVIVRADGMIATRDRFRDRATWATLLRGVADAEESAG